MQIERLIEVLQRSTDQISRVFLNNQLKDTDYESQQTMALIQMRLLEFALFKVEMEKKFPVGQIAIYSERERVIFPLWHTNLRQLHEEQNMETNDQASKSEKVRAEIEKNEKQKHRLCQPEFLLCTG